MIVYVELVGAVAVIAAAKLLRGFSFPRAFRAIGPRLLSSATFPLSGGPAIPPIVDGVRTGDGGCVRIPDVKLEHVFTADAVLLDVVAVLAWNAREVQAPGATVGDVAELSLHVARTALREFVATQTLADLLLACTTVEPGGIGEATPRRVEIRSVSPPSALEAAFDARAISVMRDCVARRRDRPSRPDPVARGT